MNTLVVTFSIKPTAFVGPTALAVEQVLLNCLHADTNQLFNVEQPSVSIQIIKQLNSVFSFSANLRTINVNTGVQKSEVLQTTPTTLVGINKF